MRLRAEDRADVILDAVVGLLEREGYDAIQVRRVAADASVSLATIYKLFGSRDELVVCALERWMADNAYGGLGELAVDGAPEEVLIDVVRTVFARWEQQPHMLAAFIRARMTPAGARLQDQGLGVVEPKVQDVLAALNPEDLREIRLIVEHVLIAVLERFAVGEIAVSEIVPILELTLRRLFVGIPAGHKPA